MRPTRRRYIALCQQLLALGVVVVALVPASGVVSLDVVGVAPATPVVPRQPLTPRTEAEPTHGRLTDHADELREYAAETTRESEVPTEPVDPVVREVSLTPKKAADPADPVDEVEGPTGAKAEETPERRKAPQRQVVSEPQAVTGVGTVGVTWEAGEVVADDAITVQVRTEQDGALVRVDAT